MAITQIIATLPAVLNDSETFYEDIAVRNNSLVTVSFPSINTWSTQANALAVEVNDKAAQVAAQAVDGGYSQTYINTNFVGVNNAQTIAGIKTFSDNPISSAAQSSSVNALTRRDFVTTLDAQNIKLTGNQTIAGVKTFSSTISGSISGNAGTVTNGVYTTGNQTIAGVKTFSSSPVVPTPTTGTQAVNKDYADLKVSLESFIGTNQSKSANGYQKLPGGLIIQWGIVNVTAVNGGFTIASYPIRFPNLCFVAIGGRNALGSNAVMLVGKAGGDPEGQVVFQNFGASSEFGSYIAIGY